MATALCLAVAYLGGLPGTARLSGQCNAVGSSQATLEPVGARQETAALLAWSRGNHTHALAVRSELWSSLDTWSSPTSQIHILGGASSSKPADLTYWHNARSINVLTSSLVCCSTLRSQRRYSRLHRKCTVVWPWESPKSLPDFGLAITFRKLVDTACSQPIMGPDSRPQADRLGHGLTALPVYTACPSHVQGHGPLASLGTSGLRLLRSVQQCMHVELEGT
jgi:hypothetical protein